MVGIILEAFGRETFELPQNKQVEVFVLKVFGVELHYLFSVSVELQVFMELTVSKGDCYVSIEFIEQLFACHTSLQKIQ